MDETNESKTGAKDDSEHKSERIEIIVAILLGITAVATAWASWQGALHGSQQDQKYTIVNNLTAEANSLYNEGMQNLNQDMLVWNQLSGLQIDLEFAEDKGDAEEVEKIEYKIGQIMDDSVSEEYHNAITWAEEQEGFATPFDNKEYVDTYFEASWEKFDEAETTMKAGDANNTHGDNQGLVTVIYAVVLFLLGINSTFKQLKTKYVVLGISGVGFVIATVLMFTIPIVLP